MNTATLAKFCSSAVEFADGLNQACARFEIAAGLRLQHFLAQCGHESAGFTRLEENLNYSVEALLSMFSRERISEMDAHRYGRSADHQANREQIANAIYGGEWGLTHLGNVVAGDGWRHRGMGLIQLTGLDNQRRCSLGVFGDQRLADHPELLLEPQIAALSAGWFWHSRDLNRLADQDDLEAVTRKINGGLLGLEDRREWLKRAKECFA